MSFNLNNERKHIHQVSMPLGTYEIKKIIIDELKKPGGTWSIKFLDSLKPTILQIEEFQTSELIYELLAYIKSDEATPHERFKVAQLISLLNSDRVGNIPSALLIHKEAISDIVEEEKTGPFVAVTKNLLRQAVLSLHPLEQVKNAQGGVAACSSLPRNVIQPLIPLF